MHDLKPLLLLLQGTLERFVDGDIKFWSSEAAGLRLENQALHKLLAEQAEEMEKLKSYVAVEHKEKARGASICWFLLFVCLIRSFDWLSTREARGTFFFSYPTRYSARLASGYGQSSVVCGLRQTSEGG